METLNSTVLLKIVRYCAYQERCRQEIKRKLMVLEVPESQMDDYFDYLETENYFNEKRFVESFCRSKFNLKSWGKYKIKAELLKKELPEKFIDSALNLLEKSSYSKKLNDLLEKKIRLLEGKSPIEIKQKAYRFGISKGYSSSEVLEEINRWEKGLKN